MEEVGGRTLGEGFLLWSLRFRWHEWEVDHSRGSLDVP